MNRPDGEPRDIELAFNCVRAVILRRNGNDAPDVQQYMAAAILRRAQFLVLFDHPEDARRDFQRTIRTWRGSADPNIRRVVAGLLLDAGRFEENQETQIGRAECRERVCKYVKTSVGAGKLKKKK